MSGSFFLRALFQLRDARQERASTRRGTRSAHDMPGGSGSQPSVPGIATSTHNRVFL